jgi:hypothetical protein
MLGGLLYAFQNHSISSTSGAPAAVKADELGSLPGRQYCEHSWHFLREV